MEEESTELEALTRKLHPVQVAGLTIAVGLSLLLLIVSFVAGL